MSQDFNFESNYDGDTFTDTDDKDYRLIGLDTPEIGEPKSQQAKRVTERFLNKPGVTTTISPGRSNEDNYGRLLRYAENQKGKDLGAKLIRKGLATPEYDSRSNRGDYETHNKEDIYHRIKIASQQSPGPRKKTNIDKKKNEWDRKVKQYVKDLAGSHPAAEAVDIESLIDAVELAPGIDPDSAMVYTIATSDRAQNSRRSANGGVRSNSLQSANFAGELANFNQKARQNGILNGIDPSTDLLPDPEDPNETPSDKYLQSRANSNRDANLATEEKEENPGDNIIVDFFQGMAMTTWHVFEFFPDVARNVVRNTAANFMGGGPNPGEWAYNLFTGNKLAGMIKGYGIWALTQDYEEARQYLDWGNGWFYDYDEAPAAIYKREKDAKMWGFEPGHPSYQAIKEGAATPGEMLSWHQTGGIHQRGWVDALFYLADPTLYSPAAVRHVLKAPGKIKNLMTGQRPTSTGMDDFLKTNITEEQARIAQGDAVSLEEVSGRVGAQAQKEELVKDTAEDINEALDETGLIGPRWDDQVAEVRVNSEALADEMEVLHNIAIGDDASLQYVDDALDARAPDELVDDVVDDVADGVKPADELDDLSREQVRLQYRVEAANELHSMVQRYRVALNNVRDSVVRVNNAANDFAAASKLENDVIDDMLEAVEMQLSRAESANAVQNSAPIIELERRLLRSHYIQKVKELLRVPDDFTVALDEAARPVIAAPEGTWRFDIVTNPDWTRAKAAGVPEADLPPRWGLAEPRTGRKKKKHDKIEPHREDGAKEMLGVNEKVYAIHAVSNQVEDLVEAGQSISNAIARSVDEFDSVEGVIQTERSLSDTTFPDVQVVLKMADGSLTTATIGPRTMHVGEGMEVPASVPRFDGGTQQAPVQFSDEANFGEFVQANIPEADSVLVTTANTLGLAPGHIVVNEDLGVVVQYVGRLDGDVARVAVSEQKQVYPVQMLKGGGSAGRRQNPQTKLVDDVAMERFYGDNHYYRVFQYTDDMWPSQLEELKRWQEGVVPSGGNVRYTSKPLAMNLWNNVELVNSGQKVMTSRTTKNPAARNPGDQFKQTIGEKTYVVTYHGALAYDDVKRVTGLDYVEAEGFASVVARNKKADPRVPGGLPADKTGKDITRYMDGAGKRHIYTLKEDGLANPSRADDMVDPLENPKSPQLKHEGQHWEVPEEMSELLELRAKLSKLEKKRNGEYRARDLKLVWVQKAIARVEELEQSRTLHRFSDTFSTIAPSNAVTEGGRIVESVNRVARAFEDVGVPQLDLDSLNTILRTHWSPETSLDDVYRWTSDEMAIPALDLLLLKNFDLLGELQKLGKIPPDFPLVSPGRADAEVYKTATRKPVADDLERPAGAPKIVGTRRPEPEPLREQDSLGFISRSEDNPMAVRDFSGPPLMLHAFSDEHPNLLAYLGDLAAKLEDTVDVKGLPTEKVSAWKEFIDDLKNLGEVSEVAAEPVWLNLANPAPEHLRAVELLGLQPGVMDDVVDQVAKNYMDVVQKFAAQLFSVVSKNDQGLLIADDGKVVGRTEEEVNDVVIDLVKAASGDPDAVKRRAGAASSDEVEIAMALEKIHPEFQRPILDFLVAIKNANNQIRNASAIDRGGENVRNWTISFNDKLNNARKGADRGDHWSGLLVFYPQSKAMRTAEFKSRFGTKAARKAGPDNGALRLRNPRVYSEGVPYAPTGNRGNLEPLLDIGTPKTGPVPSDDVAEAGTRKVTAGEKARGMERGDEYGEVADTYDGGVLQADTVQEIHHPRFLYMPEESYQLLMNHVGIRRGVESLRQSSNPPDLAGDFYELQSLAAAREKAADAVEVAGRTEYDVTAQIGTRPDYEELNNIVVTTENGQRALQVSSMPFQGARMVSLAFDQLGKMILPDAGAAVGRGGTSQIDNAPVVEEVLGAEAALGRQEVKRTQLTDTGRGKRWLVEDADLPISGARQVTQETSGGRYQLAPIIDFQEINGAARTFRIVDENGNTLVALANDSGQLKGRDVIEYLNRGAEAKTKVVSRAEDIADDLARTDDPLQNVVFVTAQAGTTRHILQEIGAGVDWTIRAGMNQLEEIPQVDGSINYMMKAWNPVDEVTEEVLLPAGIGLDDAKARLTEMVFQHKIADYAFQKYGTRLSERSNAQAMLEELKGQIPLDQVYREGSEVLDEIGGRFTPEWRQAVGAPDNLDVTDYIGDIAAAEGKMDTPLAESSRGLDSPQTQNLDQKMSEAFQMVAAQRATLKQMYASARLTAANQESAFAASVDEIMTGHVKKVREEIERRRASGELTGKEDAVLREFEDAYANGDRGKEWLSDVYSEQEFRPMGIPGSEKIPVGESESLDWLRALNEAYRKGWIAEGGAAHRTEILDSALSHLFKIRAGEGTVGDSPAVDFFLNKTNRNNMQDIANLTNNSLNDTTLVALADATTVDDLYEALGAALRGKGTGLNWDRGLQSALKRTAMEATGKNPDSAWQWWYRWRTGTSKYLANRKWSNIPWAVIGISAHDGQAVRRATSWAIGDLLRFNPTVSGYFTKGQKKFLSRKSGGGWHGSTEYAVDGVPSKVDSEIRVMFDLADDVPVTNNLVHDYWINRMIRAGAEASPAEARRNVWNELMTDLVQRGAKAQDLDPELVAVMVERFKLVQKKAIQQEGYNAATMARQGSRQLVHASIGGKVADEADKAPMLEAEFSDYLLTPDWRALRRAMKKAKFMKDSNKYDDDKGKIIERLVGPWFDSYFRTSVLAFRGSYIIRNIAEMQGRMMMSDMPSLLTSPLSLIATAISLHSGKRLPKAMARLINPKMRIGDEDIFGVQWGQRSEADEAEFAAYGDDAWNFLAARNTSRNDIPDASYQQQARSQLETFQWGSGMSDANKRRFWDGVGREQWILMADRMSNMVYWTEMAIRSGDLSVLRTWAKERPDDVWLNGLVEQADILSGNGGWSSDLIRDALVKYVYETRDGGKYFNAKTDFVYEEYLSSSVGWKRNLSPVNSGGELRAEDEVLSALTDQLWGGQRIDPETGAVLKWDDPNAVPQFAGSSYNRLRLWTWDWDSELAEVMGRIVGSKEELANKTRQVAKRSAMQKRNPATGEAYTVDNWEDAMNGWSVNALKPEIERGSEVTDRGRLMSLVDAFFRFSAKVEKGTTYLPAFRYSYWESVRDYIRYTDADTAAELVAQAEKTLGGFSGSSGLKRGVKTKGWSANTLRELKKEAQHAKANPGRSGLSKEEINGLAEDSALDFVAKNFYDAMQRNQTAYALRMVFPFIQAFVNSVNWWGKGLYKNPGKASLFAATWAAAHGEGSAENIPYWDESPSNPENSVFYTDPQTGQSMAGLPLAGLFTPIMNLPFQMLGGRELPSDMISFETPLESFNLVTQNQLVPGAGPIAQIPVGTDAVQNSGIWRALPNEAKRALMPFVNVDPDRETDPLRLMMPQWAENILSGAGVGFFSENWKKHVSSAVATLRSKYPERYGATPENDYFVDEAGMARLIKDAEGLAKGLTWHKGLMMNIFPGRVKASTYLQGDGEELIAESVLRKFYYEEMDKEGRRDKALMNTVDQFGVNALVGLYSKSSFSAQASKDAYTALASNPDVADKAPTVVSYFYPRGGYDPYMARWQNKTEYGKRSADEVVKSANELLYNYQAGELDRKYVVGDINAKTWAEANSYLTEEYNKNPVLAKEINALTSTVETIRRALKSVPALANTDAGIASQVLLSAYDEALQMVEVDGGSSLAGTDYLDLRRQLFGLAEDLVAQYPDSFPIVNRVFKPFIWRQASDADIIYKLDPDKKDDSVVAGVEYGE